MVDTHKINDLVKNILDSLPPGLKNLPKELEQHLKNAMHATFTKMDLVTREEFDAQKGVLLKTRTKLQTLEKRVQELEQDLQDRHEQE